jgi:hypothetical protein
MTEADWLTCQQPQLMLDFLRDSGRVSDRKCRLFGVACCRHFLHLLGHGACRPEHQQALSRRAVEVTERFADGLASPRDLADAHTAAHLGNNFNLCLQSVLPVTPGSSHYATPRLLELACRFVADAVASRAAGMVKEFTHLAAYAVDGCDPRPIQAALCRDIFGNPFRPASIPSDVLAWEGGLVVGLARALSDEKAFDRLPILADALEDAGCPPDQEILLHLRGCGPHVRGCFAVDVLTGRE